MQKSFVVEKYLGAAKGRNIRVIMHNGFQISGVLRTFDDFAILLRDNKDGEDKVIFIRQISTIEP